MQLPACKGRRYICSGACCYKGADTVFIDREKILKEHHNDSSVIRQEQVYTEAVNKCVKEMDRLMELKSGLYADYTEDLLDEKEYLQLNREYSQRIE